MTVFAQTPPPRLIDSLSALVTREWPLWLPLLAGAAAIYLLLPRPRRYPTLPAVAAGLAALVLAGVLLVRPMGVSPEAVLFFAFAALTVVAGGLLVTQENPARAALSFALVILSTCGLFLLLAAPFLMAATVIVYAGAIIVTFLFVVMLAQQHGHSDADARSREPALATLTGFLLLGVLGYVIRLGHDVGPLRALRADVVAAMKAESDREMVEAGALFNRASILLGDLKMTDLAADATQVSIDWPLEADRFDVAKGREMLARLEASLLEAEARFGTAPPNWERIGTDRAAESDLSGPAGRGNPAEVRRDAKTRVPHLPADNAAFLGRSLFTDFLLPVELGGTLLLVATVGAIAIAQRRGPDERRLPDASHTAREGEVLR